MEKFEVKIKEVKDFPKGYSSMYPPTEQEMWNIILQEINKKPNNKYLRHFLHTTWEPDGGFYTPKEFCYERSQTINGSSIPTGTETFWLTVYVEDR